MIDYNELLLPVSFLITLFIYSFLYKENTLFRIAEHLAVGTSAGQIVLVGIRYIQDSGIDPFISGSYLAIIPVLLGLTVFLIFKKEYSWISRYPISILAGIGIGVSVRGFVKSQFIDQIAASLTLPKTLDVMSTFNYVFGIIVVILVTSNFVFTRENETLRTSSKFGRYLIMIALGVGYSSRMMSRETQLIARITFLIETIQKWFFAG